MGMGDSGGRAFYEKAAHEQEGIFDPPWSLPGRISRFLKQGILRWIHLIPRGSLILDVGCASGDLLALLLAERPDLRVVGLDRSAGMVGLAAGRKGLQALQGDARQLPFKDHSVDLVILLGVLPHFRPGKEVSSVIREAFRVSRSWVLTEIKNPFFLWPNLFIRKGMNRLGLRLLAKFLFAPPWHPDKFQVHIHKPRDVLSGLVWTKKIRPWAWLPAPASVYIFPVTLKD